MMNRKVVQAFVGMGLLLCCASAFGEDKPVVAGEPGGGVVYGPWGWGNVGNQRMQFDRYMMTLTQLNMTPTFTLDREAKQKLQDLQVEWRTAQAKFLEDHKGEFEQMGRDQMAAYKDKDQEKIKAAAMQYQELYAKGPKSDDYVAKAKAMMTPEQVKVVEESVKKAEAEQKAMMEKWRANEQKEGKEKPGTPEK